MRQRKLRCATVAGRRPPADKEYSLYPQKGKIRRRARKTRILFIIKLFLWDDVTLANW